MHVLSVSTKSSHLSPTLVVRVRVRVGVRVRVRVRVIGS